MLNIIIDHCSLFQFSSNQSVLFISELKQIIVQHKFISESDDCFGERVKQLVVDDCKILRAMGSYKPIKNYNEDDKERGRLNPSRMFKPNGKDDVEMALQISESRSAIFANDERRSKKIDDSSLPSSRNQTQRLVSLDVFRGITVAVLLLPSFTFALLFLSISVSWFPYNIYFTEIKNKKKIVTRDFV